MVNNQEVQKAKEVYVETIGIFYYMYEIAKVTDFKKEFKEFIGMKTKRRKSRYSDSSDSSSD